MNGPGSEDLEERRRSISIEVGDLSNDHVAFEEVAFEIGIVVASLLAMALSIVLTLRALGIVPAVAF